jgi:Enoyl-CoA hydratase/isomerase
MSKIEIEHDGPLTVLSIDSPPLNLFDDELMGELADAVDGLVAKPPRGLLVRAEGRVVSGGVDVHVFDGLSPERASAMWVRLLDLVHRVEELPLPTVFAAHALCLTAAFEFSLGCDLLLAAESARFGLVETVVGLTPAMGGTQRLAERAGCFPTRVLTRPRARSRSAWPKDPPGRTPPPRRSFAPPCRKAERAARIDVCPSSPAICSPLRICARPCALSCRTGRARRLIADAEVAPTSAYTLPAKS